MRRFRISESDANERGATAIEYMILMASGFTMISGASDLAGGAMNDAFNDADNGVAGVVVDQAPGDGDDGSGDTPDAPGTGTIGYWSTHPEAWPVDSLVIGSTLYTKDQLLDIFAINADKSASMAAQLIGAKLNVLAGNDGSCVADSISAADAWLGAYPIGSPKGEVNAAWSESGDAIKTALDEYNNGMLDCAFHRG